MINRETSVDASWSKRLRTTAALALAPALLVGMLSMPAMAEKGGKGGGGTDHSESDGGPDGSDVGSAGGNGASPGGDNPSGTEGNQGNGRNVGAGNAGGPGDDGSCVGAGCGPITEPPPGLGPGTTGSIARNLDDDDLQRRVMCIVDDRLVEPTVVDEEFVCPIDEVR